ncbi:MAG TPA: PEGA domain-containing protein, partial [Chthoniobacterales bacterium]
RKRYGSSEQFLAALEQANRAGGPEPAVARGVAEAAGVAAEGGPPGRARPVKQPRAAALPRMSTVVAGAAALGLVAGAVTYEWSRPGGESPTGGLLTFRTDPADANILLDGAGMGTSGFTQRRLSAGAHRLVLARSGFQTKELSLEVKPGQTQDLGTVGLLPEGGDLSIGADVPATPFEVVGPADEKLTGVTPGKLSRLPPGPYTVHLRPPGWPEYTQTIDVKVGQGVVATHDFGEAVPLVPILPTGPTPLLQTDKTDESSDFDDEDGPVRVRRPRTARQTPLPKAEAFRRFEAKWDAKERSVQSQISAIDKRIGAASGARRDHLRGERADLERRRTYVHDMRRYERGQLRHKYGEPDGVWGSIRNVFGW